jgi:hypothetical protein
MTAHERWQERHERAERKADDIRRLREQARDGLVDFRLLEMSDR